jgi:DNA invertase Pin-like site-specific DNA recombinase
MSRPSRLPRGLDDLRGLRAARWIRESTAGQADNFGPDSQRRQQDVAIERFELVDVGLEWVVAHSGRTIATTTEWAEMLAAAGERFDVLVVGYVSRFARDLETAVTARRQLHAAGAGILFADERILTSDEDAWERWAREAVEAEAYSRRLGKRIAEGYEAKRRRLGIPGGNRPPLGTVRRGRELVVDAESLDVVQRAYGLAAAGATDRDVAAQLGLQHKHVAEVLTNPFYRGILRTGEPSAVGALVDPATWELVQANRAKYSRRHRGASSRRQYALAGLLACAACGRRLIGHSGRIRHTDACEAFRAVAITRTRTWTKTRDRRVRGESYPAELYDRAIGRALEHVAASATLKADVVERVTRPVGVSTDELAFARIRRDREAATQRYIRDRDVDALRAAMARLDADEERARVTESPTPTAAQARAYLEDLPRLWDETTVDGRRAIAQAVFERIDVLGVTDYTFTLTPAAKAHGWDVAFGAGDVSCSIGQSGRGERDRASTNDVQIRLRLAEPPAAIARSA